MKKAFLLMVGLCLASVVSARQLSWSAQSFEDYTSTTMTAALIYTSSTDTSSIAIADVLALAQEGTAAEGIENVTDTTDGKTYQTSGYRSLVNATDTTANYTTGTYYIVVWDSADATQYAVAEVLAENTDGAWYESVGPSDGTTIVPLSGLTWTGPLTVPEPTVLALLALGVAGLALKRRA